MSAQHTPLPSWPGYLQRASGAWRWLCPTKSHGFLLMPSYSLSYVDTATVGGAGENGKTEQHSPAPIASHPNGCLCERCEGLELCPSCGQQKLDIDWCFHCKCLIFSKIGVAPRAFNATGSGS